MAAATCLVRRRALADALREPQASEQRMATMAFGCLLLTLFYLRCAALHMLPADGLPSRTNVYLFNGDVADRGSHAVEIFVLIFCFMLKEPGSVFLSRGNHENMEINERAQQVIAIPFLLVACARVALLSCGLAVCTPTRTRS